MCQELGVTMDFLPLREDCMSTSVSPEEEFFEDKCNACGNDGIVNLFGMCCNCYAAAALIF